VAYQRGGELVGYPTDEEHARLLHAMEPCTASEGDLVFQKGSPSRSLLLVEQGILEVFDQVVGDDVVMATIGPGGVVGEVGFLDGRTRTPNVPARGDCPLRRLTREALLQLVRNDPQLFAKLTTTLARLVAQRFRTAMDDREPVRAFAVSLREPEDARGAISPINDIAELPTVVEGSDAEAAVKLIKDVARNSRKKRNSAGL
jgi:CRP-like cAMP-binding protein